MCGRMTRETTAKELIEIFGLLKSVEADPRYNIAPTQETVVIRQTEEGRIGESRRWGLIPSWAKDASIAAKTINARAETLSEKPSFRGAYRKCRLLVPASGYYEWQVQGRAKQPFYIHPTEGGVWAFAGLGEQWNGPEGRVDSFSVITVEANPTMADLHPRMPAIMPPDRWDAWLDSRNEDLGLLSTFLTPYSADLMEAYSVGPAVGSPRNEGPDLIKPLARP